jgi:hypothetical protein
MSRFSWSSREFHLTAAALALGMMGVYLPPPPVEFQPDETTMAVDHLLESEIDNWLESLAGMDLRPTPETRGEPTGCSTPATPGRAAKWRSRWWRPTSAT